MTVSVIIPFYNLANYVRACLDSVAVAVERLNTAVQPSTVNIQPSVEVICVDDGSTDGTGALLDEYAHSSTSTSNFDFMVIHKPNGGEGSARNAGLSAATGEWVTFLDGDDVWLPTVLTEFAAMAGRHPDADIIGFRFLPFEDGQKPPSAQAATRPEVTFDLRAEIPSEAVLDLGVFPTFFRREKFADVSFSALPLGADRLYVAQCLAKAERIVLSSVGVHGYRVRAGSMARAVWNERKIKSMIDFAAGSLAAFSASGKRIGRKGAAYLGDVLLSVTPKQIRRMGGDATAVKRHWREALECLDAKPLSFCQRIRRRWLLVALCPQRGLVGRQTVL